MSEHTKGPWRVGAETIDDEFIIETESDATIIGMARSWDGTEFRSEAEANARLIAAAPDLAEENTKLREVNKALLKACKAALTCCWMESEYDYRVIRTIHAAIKLAEGQ